MTDLTYPIKGSCQCGGVTYELLSAPLKVVACHCRQCQKLSSSAFSITAIVPASALVFRGIMSDWSRTCDSGNSNNAKFCPTCGNRIYHVNPAEPDNLKLKACNLDDTRMLKPSAHIWISEKQDWFQLPAGVATADKGA
ncbi:GFA family protein [Reinekea sp.]|jgi:hypothetical protein|uniref:GFA family protein n=1 Tax=Reinekea sp. TaxID=1970455 RepID=UPI002A81DCB0|nr:GFA family protein [Reinekea sp.]